MKLHKKVLTRQELSYLLHPTGVNRMVTHTHTLCKLCAHACIAHAPRVCAWSRVAPVRGVLWRGVAFDGALRTK